MCVVCADVTQGINHVHESDSSAIILSKNGCKHIHSNSNSHSISKNFDHPSSSNNQYWFEAAALVYKLLKQDSRSAMKSILGYACTFYRPKPAIPPSLGKGSCHHIRSSQPTAVADYSLHSDNSIKNRFHQ